MPTPARGRGEREGLGEEGALARPNLVDLSIDPTFAHPGRPTAGDRLQFPEVTGAGVSVPAKHKRIEGMASKAHE
jgi:hypothetical protein